jgi:hypothetical protein
VTDTAALSMLAAIAAVLIALTVWLVRRLRITPHERERRRRLVLNATGRITDGNVTEANSDTIFYDYSVAGVEYATSQDVTDLAAALQAAPEEYVGCTVSVKYSTHNPANSIVVCEQWSGLRSGVARMPRAPSITEPAP